MHNIEELRNAPKETRSRVIIRFQDCDPFQHLNNAKYFDYFFNAREDQVPKLYGFSHAEAFNKYKAAWVVYNHQIAYIRPARFGEWVNISSRVIFHADDTAIVEYFMADESDTHLKTLLWSTFKFVNVLTGKRQNHPEEINTYLEAVQYTNITQENITFEKRIQQIKSTFNKG